MLPSELGSGRPRGLRQGAQCRVASPPTTSVSQWNARSISQFKLTRQAISPPRTRGSKHPIHGPSGLPQATWAVALAFELVMRGESSRRRSFCPSRA